MKPATSFFGRLRDLAIDGLLLALPIVVVIIVVGKLVGQIARLFEPVANQMPQGRWFGIAAVDLAAVLALILALIIVGAFTKTRLGKRATDFVERIVLRKIPGYLMFKSVAAGFSSEERETGLKVAIVALDDNSFLGFVMEEARAPDFMVTVFVPSSPTPISGSVVLVQASRVTLVDVPVAAALQCMSRLGLGLQKLTSHVDGDA
jgi:uncharacterized membrane protein